MRQIPPRLAIRLIVISLVPVFLAPACATLESIVDGALSSADSTPTDGMREALRIGTERAVEQLGRPGGYLGDAELRIPLPGSLESIAKALRLVGQRSEVEAFERSMNRAAEVAAPLARDIFVDAIFAMTVDDALQIVRGNAHEATDYLRTHAEPRLAAAFSPVVARSLEDVGVTRDFNELTDKASALADLGVPQFDLSDYVTREALDGLFTALAREETRIRQDPKARTTELLVRWFGQ